METTTIIAEQEVIGLAIFGTAFIVTLLIVGVITYFVSALGFWKMFKKAGVPGWKAYIPFLNTYEMYKISWNVKKFWLWLGTSAVSGLLFYFAEMLAGGTAVDFLPDAIAIAVSVVALDCAIKMNRLLAKSFEKGRVFGACLWLFPFVASLILGLGKAKYIGNQSEQ